MMQHTGRAVLQLHANRMSIDHQSKLLLDYIAAARPRRPAGLLREARADRGVDGDHARGRAGGARPESAARDRTGVLYR